MLTLIKWGSISLFLYTLFCLLHRDVNSGFVICYESQKKCKKVQPLKINLYRYLMRDEQIERSTVLCLHLPPSLTK